MKVLAITPAFYPQLGGLEMVVQELAIRMRVLGVVMDVAHISETNPTLIVEEIHGIRVIRVPLYGNRFIGWSPALRHIIKGYDLLHLHDPQLLTLSANVWLTFTKIPVVLSTHGGFHHTSKYALFKLFYEKSLLKFTLRKYHRILASSVGDETYFSKYSNRVVLCGNGVDVIKFSRASTGRCRSPQRWIYWGRLSRNKRIDLIIECAAKARDIGQLVDLLICGHDFDNILDDLKFRVKFHNLENQVKFESFLNDDALLNELGDRGVYITASEHEGFGLSIVEAMAAGLIVVCRNISPINSFISENISGFFLNFDDSIQDHSILEKLLTLDDQAVKIISNNAKDRSEKYNWNSVIQDFFLHYGQVILAHNRNIT